MCIHVFLIFGVVRLFPSPPHVEICRNRIVCISFIIWGWTWLKLIISKAESRDLGGGTWQAAGVHASSRCLCVRKFHSLHKSYNLHKSQNLHNLLKSFFCIIAICVNCLVCFICINPMICVTSTVRIYLRVFVLFLLFVLYHGLVFVYVVAIRQTLQHKTFQIDVIPYWILLHVLPVLNCNI